jgi:hypothetical protein
MVASIDSRARALSSNVGIKVGPDDIAMRRQVLIWDTDSEAEALLESLQESARAWMASVPPQRAQRSISMPNTRFSRRAQLIAT